MQRLRLIKGKSYLIDNIPHLYQGIESNTYKFLKMDGTQKYLFENDLDKIKLGLQDEMYEQKLKRAEDEILYYKEKYNSYKEKEQQEAIKIRNVAAKRNTWFSDSRFVQISAGLTMVGIAIVGVKVAFEAGNKSENIAVGLLTFIGIIIGGFVVSLLIGCLAYKAEEIVDEEKAYEVFLKLVFFLPPIWYVLYRVFKLLLIKDE